MDGTTRRYFTIEEANGLIPSLELIFERVMRLRTQLKTLYKQLEQLGCAPTLESLAEEVVGPDELRRARGLFKALAETLSEDLAQVEAIGASVKDVEIGLIDFWCRRNGADVLLCWQFGEKSIRFWHEPDAGFAGRRPLDGEIRSSDRTLH